MKNVTSNKLTGITVFALVLLILTPCVFAYPPDNAAVLYYRACNWYQADDAMEKMLQDFLKGRIKVNEKIEKFVEKSRHAIDFAITAADVPNCDWGEDYSKGMSMLMPPLAKFRNIARAILADAKILAAQGNYKTAITRCLSVRKFARHVSDSTLVTCLVGGAINRMANECIQDILADMPKDSETLNWFKNQLVNIENGPFSVKAGINNEVKLALVDMRMEKTDEILEILSDESFPPPTIRKLAIDRIRVADERFFERNRNYYKNFMADIQTVMDMPYPRAHIKLEELSEKPEKEAVKNPDATLTAIFVPALSRVYSIGITDKTFSNAIRAAVEIYIIKAKTGKLPDALPTGLPGDLFSDKPFQYERTAEGFILRCQGKDLNRNKIHEYEFKVKK